MSSVPHEPARSAGRIHPSAGLSDQEGGTRLRSFPGKGSVWCAAPDRMFATSLQQHLLTDLISALSRYQEAARAEEDAAYELYQRTIKLEHAILEGSVPATPAPEQHPVLVDGREAWHRAARQAASAYRDWEATLNAYLGGEREGHVEVQLHDGCFIPVEQVHGEMVHLRSFDNPETTFSTCQQAVLWLHQQMTWR